MRSLVLRAAAASAGVLRLSTQDTWTQTSNVSKNRGCDSQRYDCEAGQKEADRTHVLFGNE